METYFCGLCHRFYVACCRYFLSKNYFKYFAKNVRWQSLFSAATTINASICFPVQIAQFSVIAGDGGMMVSGVN